MTILERTEKQKKFVEKTSVILAKLNKWKIECETTNRKPSEDIIRDEWSTFFYLAEEVEEDGIANGTIFYEQEKALIEAFKFFEDIVPEFKQLN